MWAPTTWARARDKFPRMFHPPPPPPPPISSSVNYNRETCEFIPSGETRAVPAGVPGSAGCHSADPAPSGAQLCLPHPLPRQVIHGANIQLLIDAHKNHNFTTALLRSQKMSFSCSCNVGSQVDYLLGRASTSHLGILGSLVEIIVIMYPFLSTLN